MTRAPEWKLMGLFPFSSETNSTILITQYLYSHSLRTHWTTNSVKYALRTPPLGRSALTRCVSSSRN